MLEFSKRGVLLAAFALNIVFAPMAFAAEQTAAGFWKQIDPDTKKLGGYIQIREKHGEFEGYISKMFPKPGDPVDPVCSGCTDDRKDKKVLGIRLIQHLKRDGNTYEGGTILDPRDGTEYNVKLTLSDDGQTLTVRGYVGISLLGQSQEWERLPGEEVAKLEFDKDAVIVKDHAKKDKKKKAKGHPNPDATTPAPAAASDPAAPKPEPPAADSK